MPTTPYDSRAERELPSGALRHVYEVRATHPSWGEDLTLWPVTGGLEVTFDEGWAPHVRAQVRVMIPDDPAELALLDPRAGVRIVIEAGYMYSGDTVADLHEVADLGLRTRVVARPGNVVTLTATSDEAILMDRIWAEVAPGEIPTTGISEAAEWIVETATGETGNFLSYVAAGYRPDLLTEAVMPLGVDWWSVLSGIVDDAGLWIRDRGDRVFELRARPTGAGRAAGVLATGPGGLIVSSESALTLDEWGNAVYLVSTWRDESDVEHRVQSIAYTMSGPYDVTEIGTRWQMFERTHPTTQGASDDAARALLARCLTRGRRVSVTAPAMYWLRPGDTVTVQLPTGDQERHVLSSVGFDPTAGLMSVTTRLPEDAEITNGE